MATDSILSGAAVETAPITHIPWLNELTGRELSGRALSGIERLAQVGGASTGSLERSILESRMQRDLKGRDLRRMSGDLDLFERRATSAGLTSDQVAETYKQVTRLFDAGQGATLPADQRLRLAQQVLRNAARPTSIDQGHHGTCNVSVVESRVYAKNPEAAARLVADIATTGSFRSKDGSLITPTMRSLSPDDEARTYPPANGERGFASQVFQMTAANIKWQRTVVTPDGHIASKGKITYEQIPSKRSSFSADTGERVMDYSQNPPRETTSYKQGPALSVSDLPDIANQITGRSDSGFVIENKVHAGRFTEQVSSPKELEQAILDARQNGQLPAFIRVHTGNDPFLSDSGGTYSRQRGVWHVVSITDYDPRTKKVTIDNQWGSRGDRTVDLDKLYKATMEPGTDAWKKKHELYINPGFPGFNFPLDLQSLSPFQF